MSKMKNEFNLNQNGFLGFSTTKQMKYLQDYKYIFFHAANVIANLTSCL